MRRRFSAWWRSADSSVQIHRTLTLLWIFPGLPITFLLRNSIWWLSFMAVYSIIVGHWGVWQAATVEKKQESS